MTGFERTTMCRVVSSLRALAVAVLLMGAAGNATAQTPTPTPLGPGPLIPFFGPVDQDGCPGCCDPSCTRTPLPTPLADPFGRPIFVRPQGRFLLVVEGARGENRQAPGSNLPSPCGGGLPCDTTDRGDVWIMADRDLGNASAEVCDTGITGGGVPAVPPLDFRGTQDVTDSIRDLMCRFTMHTGSFPCTLNENGGWAFLDGTTVRQYCFPVPQSVVFPAGDTVLAAQIRDNTGFFGERREIVVRVAGGATGATAGRIRYYSADRSVADATVRLLGTLPDSTVTGTSGDYAFPGVDPGDWTVQPEKLGGFGSGVSSLDAAWVLQVLLEKRSFSAEQTLACDVTGNGSLSSLDAAHILQFVTEKRTRFTVGENCGSDWAFLPSPDAAPDQTVSDPVITPGLCQPGAISYTPLASALTGQDFLAALFGDCTGNWQPPGGAGAALTAGARASAWLGEARRGRQRFRVPLYVDADLPFHAVEARLHYDRRVLQPVRVRAGRSAFGAMIAFHEVAPGVLSVALASADEIEGGGDAVLRVEFERLNGRARRRSLGLISVSVDEAEAAVHR